VLPLFASRALEVSRHAVGVEARRYGGMEAGCRRVDVERVGALEVRCRRADVEAFASRDLELGRHAAAS